MKPSYIIFFAAIFICFFFHAGAQRNSEDVKWNYGTLLLSDSTMLNGFIQNNEKFRLVKFKKLLTDTAEIPFQERRILSMQFFDSTLSTTRNFFTLEIQDEGSLYHGPVLFEVIMVMKNFVVLSRKFGVLPNDKAKGRGDDTPIEYDQVEKIFLAGEDSKAELLLLTVLMDSKDVRKQDHLIEPFFDWDVLKKFTGSKWNDVKAYIKKNRLNVYRKGDLLATLAYYRQLNN